MRSLAEIQAKKVLCSQSFIVDSEKAVEAGKVLVTEFSALESRRMVESWTAQTERVPLNTFCVYIIHFLCYTAKNATLFAKCQHKPLSHWFDKL